MCVTKPPTGAPMYVSRCCVVVPHERPDAVAVLEPELVRSATTSFFVRETKSAYV